MSSMKFLLFVFIPLTNSLVNPSSNELISKSLSQSSGSSLLNSSNEVIHIALGPKFCESGWTYFDKTEACYKLALEILVIRIACPEYYSAGLLLMEEPLKVYFRQVIFCGLSVFVMFYVTNVGLTFLDANAYDAEHICNTLGGHLTSIHSLAENIFVAELSRMGRQWKDEQDLTWIGLLAEGTGSKVWAWTDGTKVDYQAWVVGAPQVYEDQRCVLLYSDHRLDSHYPAFYQKWNDWYCAKKQRSFVCKKTALHHITELHIRAITNQ